MKKILSILLIVVLVFSLSACGAKSNETNTNEGADAKENDKVSNEKVKLSLVMKDEIPSDPIVIKYFEAIEQGLAEEGINVDIELIEMPAGNYAEKLNLMLLGGTVPDIIYFQGGDQQVSQQGLLEDLTPYIEKSKYIKESLETHNIKRLENYPYLLWIKPINSKIPVVRGDWFSKLETSNALLENPSIDNYFNLFKELKEKDFSGNGNPTYGVTVAGNISELDQIFDQAFGNTSTWVKDENGKYIYNRVSNGEKEKLAFYNKLYEEGILDSEYLTKKWDTKEQAFYDNQVGVIIGTAGKVIDIYDGKMKKANGEESGLIALPPAKGKGQGYLPVDVSKETRGIAISALSEHKEEAFKVLEFLASPKGQKLDRLGFENEHYEVKENKAVLTEKSQEWYARFWEPTNFNIDIELATPLLGYPAAESLKLANQYYTEDINFLIPEEYTAKWDAMENLYKEYSADIITGKRQLDEFDKFVEEWYKAGGKEISKYANETLK
ncbi:extracellular solute-binding protein [Brassicibacter mesophilus]|uniref:extracellular solute-binding protein n=1 Tax=Brassicibacter mesophilus TaxID=745119 RepID=UPI003D1995F9